MTVFDWAWLSIFLLGLGILGCLALIGILDSRLKKVERTLLKERL